MVEKNPPKGATKPKGKTAVTAKNKDLVIAKVAPATKALAKQNAVPFSTQPVVDVAAVTEPAVTPANNPATINTPARKIALERISEPYKTSYRQHFESS